MQHLFYEVIYDEDFQDITGQKCKQTSSMCFYFHVSTIRAQVGAHEGPLVGVLICVSQESPTKTKYKLLLAQKPIAMRRDEGQHKIEHISRQSPDLEYIALFIPYYGLFLCDIQVCVLQIEINQASDDQSI